MLAADFISKIRIAIIAFLIFVLYAVLGIRLWQIQVLKGEDTRDVVTRQYLRKIRIPAIRGRILTSDGVPLADNRPSMDVVFHVSEMRQPGSLGKTIDFITEKVQFVARAIGRTDFPGGDYEDLLSSIREKLLTLDEGLKICPGHMGSSTIGAEKRSNPYLR